MRLSTLLLPLLLLGCRNDKGTNTDTAGLDDGGDEALDLDGDGYTDEVDCDDSDASVNPGVDELCNEVDDDCDGEVDEGVQTTWYADADADGYGDAATSTDACDAPAGTTADGTDCDDSDPEVFPDAPERCDNIDNDCDGDVDEDVLGTWYADSDGDGFGDAAAAIDSCDPGEGYVADDTDCNDAEGTVFPGADEVCDELDNDCDGTVDEDVTTTFYADTDDDGYGDPGTTAQACVEPEGYSADAGDCDDGDPAVSPAATEVCNGIDDDCSGATDDADAGLDTTTASTWYADSDTDGYGDPAAATLACDQPSGTVTDDTDCDDTDIAVNPAATEVCNGTDDDCDGDIDDDDASLDSTTASTWYADSDTDGYGDSAVTTLACTQPAAHVADDTDCDDSDIAVNPAATEVCNGTDDDCDGDIDDDDASLDSSTASTWYADSDTDGYGDSAVTTLACTQPAAHVADDTDCDDTDIAVNPAATEVCNGTDDDCDGDTDETLIGSGAACPGDSCLDVLERGTPIDSDDYWIDPAGSGAVEEYCDYGTVGSGWAWRLPVAVTNPDATDYTDHQVPVVLDTATLIAASKLSADGADLRFFTHDGPLLEYWIETFTLDSATTTVWITLPQLPASDTVDLTATYGNSGTERRSLAWLFDPFEADTSAAYNTVYDGAWGTPAFTWNTSAGTLEANGTNADFFLQADASYVDLEEPVYVEVSGTEYDNDGFGATLFDTSGALLSAVVTDDYNGAANTSGNDALVWNSAPPSGHRQASYLLDLGDVASASSGGRVGLLWDGAEAAWYWNGSEQDRAATTLALDAAGLVSFASQGSPGVSYEHLWIGPEAITFDPSTLSSPASAATGSETAF